MRDVCPSCAVPEQRDEDHHGLRGQARNGRQHIAHWQIDQVLKGHALLELLEFTACLRQEVPVECRRPADDDDAVRVRLQSKHDVDSRCKYSSDQDSGNAAGQCYALNVGGVGPTENDWNGGKGLVRMPQQKAQRRPDHSHDEIGLLVAVLFGIVLAEHLLVARAVELRNVHRFREKLDVASERGTETRTKTTIENREAWQPRVLVVEQQYSLGVPLSGRTETHRQGQKQAEGTSAETSTPVETHKLAHPSTAVAG